MTYQAWTWEVVRDRLIEAAETLRRLPRNQGPKEFGSSMPEVVRKHDEAYGYEPMRYRGRLDGAAIDRMEKAWAWVNANLDELDRKLVYGWSAVKVRKGLSIARFAEENGTYERMLRREIKRCCQVIANNLNRVHLVRLNGEDCCLSENHAELTSTTVSSESRDHGPAYWIASDGKPLIDPALPAQRHIDHRDIRARHSERNRSLGAKV